VKKNPLHDYQSFRVCSFEGIDMGKSVKMNLCKFGWMNFCVFFLVDLESKVNGFEDKFYES